MGPGKGQPKDDDIASFDKIFGSLTGLQYSRLKVTIIWGYIKTM